MVELKELIDQLIEMEKESTFHPDIIQGWIYSLRGSKSKKEGLLMCPCAIHRIKAGTKNCLENERVQKEFEEDIHPPFSNPYDWARFNDYCGLKCRRSVTYFRIETKLEDLIHYLDLKDEYDEAMDYFIEQLEQLK